MYTHVPDFHSFNSLEWKGLLQNCYDKRQTSYIYHINSVTEVISKEQLLQIQYSNNKCGMR